MQRAASQGIVVQPIAAKAPWQQGHTERYGAHYKDLLEKSRQEIVITNERELQLLMQELEMAKNRFSNRSGFSPVQRQIGQWPRAPISILSDDVIDPGLLGGAVVDEIEREMRRVTHKAFIEHNAREAIKKAGHARSRVSQEFQAGDYVFVCRVPRQKKRRHAHAQEERMPEELREVEEDEEAEDYSPSIAPRTQEETRREPPEMVREVAGLSPSTLEEEPEAEDSRSRQTSMPPPREEDAAGKKAV